MARRSVTRPALVAELAYRTGASKPLPYLLLGVSLIGLWYAVAGHAWTSPGQLAIAVVFIAGVLLLAGGIKLMNDRLAIGATTEAFVVRGLMNEIRVVAPRASVQEIVLSGQQLLLLDSKGEELYRTVRTTWSDEQIEAFGRQIGIPVRPL